LFKQRGRPDDSGKLFGTFSARYAMDVGTQSVSVSSGENHCPAIFLFQYANYLFISRSCDFAKSLTNSDP
jgi:hypothetical protein